MILYKIILSLLLLSSSHCPNYAAMKLLSVFKVPKVEMTKQ